MKFRVTKTRKLDLYWDSVQLVLYQGFEIRFGFRKTGTEGFNLMLNSARCAGRTRSVLANILWLIESQEFLDDG